MSVKASILRKLRNSLDVAENDDIRRNTVAERLSNAPRNLIPERGQLPLRERIDLFAERAEKVSTSVARVASSDDVPKAVAEYLRARNLPQAFRMGADPRLEALPWDSVPTLEIKRGASDGSDLVGLSHAFGAAAETGTLALTSGEDNPTTLNFLPETHVVVVGAEDIAGDMETLWDRLRAFYGKGEMPRCVNLVTGPSRSADIEQKLQLGAHGPKALHIVVVG